VSMRSFTSVVPSFQLTAERRAALPVLLLGFHERSRTRFGVTLDTGEDVGIALPRGTVLRPGDVLSDGEGGALRVDAAAETVSVVRSTDTHRLMRAAYHLGNRHVGLQIALDELAYLHDHVLDGMMEALGLRVEVRVQPFEAEPGPYGSEGSGQGHGHAHDPSHGAPHAHDHAHPHGHGHAHEHPHDHGPAHRHGHGRGPQSST